MEKLNRRQFIKALSAGASSGAGLGFFGGKYAERHRDDIDRWLNLDKWGKDSFACKVRPDSPRCPSKPAK